VVGVTRPEDRDADRLSAESLASGDPVGWFERLYAEAQRGTAIVPWDRGTPNAMLVEWAAGRFGDGRTAMVVGCGLGRDAEFVRTLGFETHAFDVSPTAIETARARHLETAVRYEVADLLALPARWRRAFDLVVESHNVQSLPPELHAAASAAVASLVAAGGTLLVLAAAGDGTAQGPPWPLTRGEIEAFAVDGLRLVSADLMAIDVPRWRAVFER
jgi:SAM-dependent methyltransferase